MGKPGADDPPDPRWGGLFHLPITMDHRDHPLDELLRSVAGDEAQGVTYPRVAPASHQRRAVAGHLVAGEREDGGDAIPPILQPLPAPRVGQGLRDSGVAQYGARVGEQGVTTVQEAQLPLRKRPDVAHEAGAGTLPGRSPGREVSGEHPFAEGFGHHGATVVTAGGALRRFQVGCGGGRGYPIHDRGGERDARRYPVVQMEPRRAAHLEDHGTGRVAVAQEVVAGDDGDRSAIRDPASREAGHEPPRHGAERWHRLGARHAQTLDVGGDLRVTEIEVPIAVQVVSGLRDGHRHHGNLW